MKRLFAIVLTLALVLSCAPAISMQASAAASGSCGDNLTWTLDDAGTLTISGTGPMMDASVWEGLMPPWDDYKAQIKQVIIEPGATTIGLYMFANCSNLTKVTIPEGVTTISDEAFWNCYNLTDITLPEGLKTIGWEAFNCCGMTTINIPDSVTYIADSAFRYSSLTSVRIPASVTYIGSWAFGTGSLTEIWVDENNTKYSSDATGALLNKEQTILWRAPSITGTYIVADGVATIGDGAFEGCSAMTGVVIPDSVTQIEFTAFNSCGALTDVYYTGTQEKKGNINISEGLNDPLFNATWHYEVAALDDSGAAYSSVEDALNTVTSGTITLLTDATVDSALVKPGVTLDLNGKTLTADVVFVFAGGTIQDGGENCTGGGLLKVAKDNIMYAQNDAQNIIPVWNGADGYIFTKVTFLQTTGAAFADGAQYIFLPVFTNKEASALLADGGADNGLKIKAALTWNDGQSQQFYTYSEDLVKQVFDGTGRWVFDLTITGITGITDMVASPLVICDCVAQASTAGTAVKAA